MLEAIEQSGEDIFQGRQTVKRERPNDTCPIAELSNVKKYRLVLRDKRHLENFPDAVMNLGAHKHLFALPCCSKNGMIDDWVRSSML